MSNQASHEEYWQKRIDDIFRHVDQTDLDVFAELSKIYSDGAREAQRDLYEFLSKYAEGQALTLSETSQRLFGDDLSDYRQNAQRYREQAEKDPELFKRLNEQYASARATRLDALQMDLTARLGIMQGVLRSTLEDYFLKVAAHSYRKVMGGRSGAINAPALKELVLTPFDGKNFSNTLWGHVDNLAKDLKKSLTTGFIRGNHPRVMAQELAKKFKVANSRAETLVRTEGTAIVNRSVARRYQDAGLLYYRDLVHLDNRTTKICRDIAAKDERKLLSEMKPGINAAPYHFNCRTGIIPDEEELGGASLAAGDGKVYNQGMSNLDLMAKQRSFTVGNDVRVKTKKLNGTDDFWAQDNTKKIRDTIFNVQSSLKELNDYPTPTVVFLKKSRLPGFAGYDYKQDILFVSDALHSEIEFSKVLSDNYFAARDIKDTLVHELTHKKHWDSAKAFYKANKKRYNSVEEAMSVLNAPLVSYVKEQLKHDFNYLVKVSPNADEAFILGNVNELVADVAVLGERVHDEVLYQKVQEVLSWK